MGCSSSKPSPTKSVADKLAGAGLTVLRPSDEEYQTRQESYWSNSAKLRPACIVRPGDAAQVAEAVRVLTRAGQRFAVRSGGHTQWAGANNIEGGVTVDLGLLCWTRLDAGSGLADVGPGAVWADVYAVLERHGRVVAGGREGNVGVAGLVLGGGNTFFTPRHGFACDNVAAFEVVLADGSVVTADAGGAHADLYWALKGGSGNFGIVTNIRMRTLESGPVWGGLTFFPKEVTLPAAEALVDFTDSMERDPDSNLLCFMAYTDVGIATMFVQVAGVPEAPAYKKWLDLPSIMSTCKMTTVAELVSDPANNLPKGYHNIWFTATFRNDARIVARAAELHEALVADLLAPAAAGGAGIPAGDLWTQCLFQPLPELVGRRSAAAGGNATGVERQRGNGLLFLAAAMVRARAHEGLARPRVRAWAEAVRAYAAGLEEGPGGGGGGGGGGVLPWVYLNYADRSQDPLGSYGVENVKRLGQVAVKYDPGRVFQQLCPGGFKISDVEL